MLDKIKIISIIIALLSTSFSVVWTAHRIDAVSRKTEDLLVSTDRTSKALADAAEIYSEQVRSPQNLKSIEHGLEFGKVATLTISKLNRTTIPKLNSAIDDFREKNLASLNSLIKDSNSRINGDEGLIVAGTNLLNSMTKLANKFGISVDDLNTAIIEASKQANKSLEAIYSLITDPSIKDMLLHFDESSASMAKVMAKIAEAGESAPGIAKSLENIAKQSSKFAKITLIVGILSTLAKAFIP